MPETIAAIATPPYVGGISVIRISGPDALAVGDRVFVSRAGKRLSERPGYTALFGGVRDAAGREVDESVATVFRAPKSYTGEDVVEISCHGGIAVTREVLQAVLAAGARPAGPGEFTKRAFLNGKLSLTQAEAVADLIAAQGRDAAAAAKSQHDGALARRLASVRSELTAVAGHLAAWADYPEEDLPELDPAALLDSLRARQEELRELLRTFDTGLLVREGIDTVIVGRPNVGKSTLMNLLSGQERSIVTDIAGTTRDVIEETVRLDGLILRLSDTAGLRTTEDPVEQIGVERARKRMDAASLILAVFDGSDPLNEEDMTLADSLQGRPVIAVVNKSDLPQRLDTDRLRTKLPTVLCLSAGGPDADRARALLSAEIREKVGLSDFDPTAPMLNNERQREAAGRCLDALCAAEAALRDGMTMDAVTVLVEEALDALLELSGDRVGEEVVNAVFSRFCVGK